MTKVRTRFAPSPTGYLHVGGIRTALFAYLVARQNHGDFILRLEDTDQSREVSGADEHIMKSLKALGLNYDEGPDIGGKYGPYRQSERLKNYRHWANKLVEAGRAYADPYTTEEVQNFRNDAAKNKRPFLYRNHRPTNPPKWDGTKPLRFKSDPRAYIWVDEVMGEISTGPEVIDDFILMKSDGFPTYNFAHIIDDLEMEITHIIRGQEFLSSVPNYLNLYEALGIKQPIMATMPHILGPDGQKKLSKRDGAKDVLDYIRDGYLVDALVNFIASLGWNDGTEQEIFSHKELINKFRLDHVQKSGAHFDEKRLLWMNGHYIRELSIDKLFKLSSDYWPAAASQHDDAYKKLVLGVIQERLKYLSEIPELTTFFFSEPRIDLGLIDNNKQLSKLSRPELSELLKKSLKELKLAQFTIEDISSVLNKLLEETGQKPGVLFSLIRIATTWAPASPSLAESLAILGKRTVENRLTDAIQALAQ